MSSTINLLTGPVAISEAVMQCWATPPTSHRSENFIKEFNKLSDKLTTIVNCKNVAVMSGSGTLANEAVGFQIGQLQGKGLILNNGEFGRRITAQAEKLHLDFIRYAVPWSESFHTSEIKKIIAENGINWIWMVLHETSTGIWNDYVTIQQIADDSNIKLCIDGVSAIATQHIDFSKVYLATGVSGKALCSYPGLCFVFYNHTIQTSNGIPSYLDIGHYNAAQGIPFTISSNQVAALNCAVTEAQNWLTTNPNLQILSNQLSLIFKENNCTIINTENASPAVVTAVLPQPYSSIELGDYLEKNNCLTGYKSKYLTEKNWIQTFVTRNTTDADIIAFKNLMHSFFEEKNTANIPAEKDYAEVTIAV